MTFTFDESSPVLLPLLGRRARTSRPKSFEEIVRRARTSLNGGCRWFMTSAPTFPTGSFVSITSSASLMYSVRIAGIKAVVE